MVIADKRGLDVIMAMHKINFKGKEYIGTIISINAKLSSVRDVNGNYFRDVIYYEVEMIPKDESVTISDIIIRNLNEIEPYED